MTRHELLEIVDDALSEIPLTANSPAEDAARITLVKLGRAILRRLGDDKPEVEGTPV